MVLLIVLIGIILACFIPIFKTQIQKGYGWILAVIPALQFAYFANLVPGVSRGHVYYQSYNWFPSFDINLSFLLDGLSLVFAMIITLVGVLIFLYGNSYLKGSKRLAFFYAILLVFMSSMLGLVLSANLITLFIFWELTSISSYLLIGFNYEDKRSRHFALQSLLITGSGGLAMLAGFILMGSLSGTYSIYEILQNPEHLHASYLMAPIAILILIGAFTKSAQFPFHFWLPNAMVAPTPVSAYLHSATMVKAGVYLIARFNPVLIEWAYWSETLLVFGSITMVLGAIWAIGQTDLKRILAYTTVCALGTLVFLIGLDNPSAYLTFGIFLIVHALYKASLFMVAGTIDHATATRDITKLKGLFSIFPLLAITAILAGMSNAGLPPFLGFYAKEGIYASIFTESGNHWIWGVLAIISNICLVATAFMVGLKAFWGKKPAISTQYHKLEMLLILPALFASLLGLAAGIFSGTLEVYLLSAVFASLTTVPLELNINTFAANNVVLQLSILTLVLGLLIYLLAPWKRLYSNLLKLGDKFGAESSFDLSLSGIQKLATFNTKAFQSGSLRNYLTWILCTVLFLIYYTFWKYGLNFPEFKITDVYIYDYLLVGIILVSAMVALWIGTLLSAIVALGVVGYGIAIIFVFFGAPDLALTQFSIESLTIVIFVLVAAKLPEFERISSLSSRMRDKLLASLTGVTMTLLVLMFVDVSVTETISSNFLEKSYIEAKGRNVVNVILVDFRAFDTLGEIAVLAIAAVGIYTLLHLKSEENEQSL